MPLPHALRSFLDDEGGSVTVEAVLFFPVLAWVYLAMFVFFDGFREQSVNVKAAYTLGDILSRQTDYVTPEFMDSLFALQGTLTDTPLAKRLRVTTVSYRASDNSYLVRWSRTRGTVPQLTNASLATMRARIPRMSDGEVSVLTETWMDYAPAMNVGIHPFTFSELVVTRPRFALNGRFCYNTVNDNGTPATETC